MNQIKNYLNNWYLSNKRDLPWRRSQDPYKIWLSEIILQQTRVNQGMEYYFKFIEKYPGVFDLAKSSEEEVLKSWQGLGYYSRARNLHKTAKIISKQYNGKFPENYDELIKLPGIGTYTAAAISSIAFNKKHAVIDGNVIRFYSRLFGIKEDYTKASVKKELQDIASQMIEDENPGEFNQAVMEFGALMCLPKKPKCDLCELKTHCYAYRENMVNELPQKYTKTVKKNRYLNYFVLLDKHSNTFIVKREGEDIWKNLYEFPLIETSHATDLNKLVGNKEFIKLIQANVFHILSASIFYKHTLSHQLLNISFHILLLDGNTSYLEKKLKKISLDNISEVPVPRPIHKFIEENLKKYQN